MKYVLESTSEAERLERQSSMKAYDYRKELADLEVPDGARILDAGCGTGVVCRYLAQRFPNAQIVGCDLSRERLKYASDAARGLSNVTFGEGDLAQLPFEAASFDVVVCRYVFQHLVGKMDGLDVAAIQVLQVLKSGGTLHVIDSDGLFLNSHPQTPLVAETLARLVAKGPVDFFVGRKIPALLTAVGFEDVQWRVQTVEFRGETLEDEIKMTRERLEATRPFLEQFLGSPAETNRFVTELLAGLRKEGAVYFLNKFIVGGKKPRQRGLRVVR